MAEERERERVVNNAPNVLNPPLGFNTQNGEGKASLEDLVHNFISESSTRFKRNENNLDSMETHLTNRGVFPSNTEVNPREQCKAVILRSGKELGTDKPKAVDDEEVEEIVVESENSNSKNSSKSAVVPEKPHMLHYAKFMKDVMARKRKLEEFETMKLTEECSAILQKKLPQKLKDPWSFTIPCIIGGATVNRALCDLGASINLMPLSIFRSLELGEVKPTTITLQLADRSLTYPRGVVEDVLEGELTLRVGGEAVTFNIYKTMKYQDEVHSCNRIDLSNSYENNFCAGLELENALARCLINSINQVDDDDWELREQFLALESLPKEKDGQDKIKALSEEVEKEFLGVAITGCAEKRRLAGYKHYCFLDGYSGYNQIAIAPEDQEKTTFTCPYGTYAFRRMPFGLCNAPATFQRCMMAIFSDMVEEVMEIFMDDFSVFGSSFDHCLHNLTLVLQRFQEKNLVLNWEKCHFMVQEGIVLGHKVSSNGLEVDRAKVVAIEKLPPPNNAFTKIKEALISAPIMIVPDWKEPFEVMCDTSDYAVGPVLGQRRDKMFRAIYYVSRTLDGAQQNYTTTEKEMLAVVFSFEKFRSYLIGSKVIVYTDHAAIRYLFAKKDAKPRLIRWILLLQEFDFEIRDKKGSENLVADHLSHLELEGRVEHGLIKEKFPDEHLFEITSKLPWFADFANFLSCGVLPPDLNHRQRKKFFHDVKFYL
ncbi:uncharacterized protein [Henckelia pumila]|uniref:uncharacterized protein n=1 Tax=Henckelia pumila TaxID=405737 RepID=UPI003C6E396A